MKRSEIAPEQVISMYSAKSSSWRAEVGMLAPAPGLYREYDIVAPEGVRFSQAILGLVQCTPEDLKRMNENIEVEAKKLNMVYKSDLICLGCTSGSFIGGPSYDKEIIARIENASGSIATTTTTCVLEVFKDMGIEKIALVGPYIESIFNTEVKFLEEHGIKTLYMKGLGIQAMAEMWRYTTDPYICYHLVKEAAQATPNADCVFVTCMGSWILATADKAEEEIRIPVISSASATLYGILKKLKVPDPVYNYGQALRRQRLS